MKSLHFDVNVAPNSLQQMPKLAKSADQLGFDALWTSETQHDPFMPLALAAEHTDRVQLGTAIAVALARSPGTVAYTSWDLAAATGGRFILGLGSQVRAHIERRFGLDWPENPTTKMREFVGALRAFWRCWQGEADFNFQGDHYRLRLMTPFFNPGPIDHPDIPIFLAGVNRGSLRLAGEVAEGLHGHPLHTPRYLREVVRPALGEGAKDAGRDPDQIQLSVTAFVISTAEEEAEVRRQIAFYASTPNYRPVMALHGWGEVADRLGSLVRQGDWKSMPALITPDMLENFAVRGQGAELGAALRERYQGLADRVNIYRPLRVDEDKRWQPILEGFRN